MPIRWQCPEAVLGQVYSAKSDVYSYGVLLYEIYSGGATPYSNLAATEVLNMVRAGERLPRAGMGMDDDMFALMRSCTSARVSERPSMASVLAKLSGTWTLEQDTGPSPLAFPPLMAANPAAAAAAGSPATRPVKVLRSQARRGGGAADEDDDTETAL